MHTYSFPWLKSVIALVAVVIVLGYAYGRLEDLIEGPLISITSPANGTTLTEPLAIIRGRADRVASIKLNGREIFISKDGQLAEAVVLAPGYNALQLSADDRFGRTTTVNVELVYKDARATSTQAVALGTPGKPLGGASRPSQKILMPTVAYATTTATSSASAAITH